MSERRERTDWLVMAGVTVLADLMLFMVLDTSMQGLVLSRLMSLVLAYGIAQAIRLLTGFGKPPRAFVERPGLWPLVVITVVVNTGLFVVLSERAPIVQPVVHLVLSWLGSLAFLAFGLKRIRRFQRPDGQN
ncbi:hypothetical protein [Rhizobium sp. Root149]|uniref:hypothetical protein n=1 Tax=Rhizobium sp. Root149 TaxID=1736473 RepID=UPI000A9E6045|nr:hypothetical protein [Rhizobium sp. Root149]